MNKIAKLSFPDKYFCLGKMLENYTYLEEQGFSQLFSFSFSHCNETIPGGREGILLAEVWEACGPVCPIREPMWIVFGHLDLDHHLVHHLAHHLVHHLDHHPPPPGCGTLHHWPAGQHHHHPHHEHYPPPLVLWVYQHPPENQNDHEKSVQCSRLTGISSALRSGWVAPPQKITVAMAIKEVVVRNTCNNLLAELMICRNEERGVRSGAWQLQENRTCLASVTVFWMARAKAIAPRRPENQSMCW